MDQVREQHVERAIDFLSDKLKIYTEDEAIERTFLNNECRFRCYIDI